MQYVIGSWYKPDELGKRACIFHVRTVSSTIFTRPIFFFCRSAPCSVVFCRQWVSLVYILRDSVEPPNPSRLLMKGWMGYMGFLGGSVRCILLIIFSDTVISTWLVSFLGLFIIDGIITIPIALVGFMVMPDLPHNTKPSWLYTEPQLEMARKRMAEVNRKPPSKFTKAKVLGFFKTWHIYTLVPCESEF